ncbi:MAG: acyltransferase, partial [Bacteroidota bacterium]
AFMSGKSSKLYWKNYALRRFLRIYPLFVIALFFYGFLSFIGLKTVIDKLIDIPLHMLLIRGESIFWSIPVEFKYYFVSPLIMWICHKFLNWDKIKLAIFFVLLIFASIIIEFIYKLPLVSTIRFFPIFLVGTVISIYEIIERKEVIQAIKPVYFNLLGIIAGMLILITVPYYFEKIFGFKIEFYASTFYLPYAILWGLILLAAKYGKGIIKTILELKLLRFIGSISFSIYLFHIPFLEFVKGIGLHSDMKIYLFFLLTIIFSTFSFLFIERPLSKIRIYSKNITEKDLVTKNGISKG